jgi:hypothetical protein
MKMTIDSHGFRNAFAFFGRNNQFSHNGFQALFNHFEEIEQGGGGEIELDVIGMCCEFTEFDTALEAALDFHGFINDQELTEQEQERQALQFLSDSTTIIPFDGGIIIQNF